MKLYKTFEKCNLGYIAKAYIDLGDSLGDLYHKELFVGYSLSKAKAEFNQELKNLKAN